MQPIKYDTFNCTRCNKEVLWYEKGDTAWREWEYARKVCSTCREATMTAEDRDQFLPKPTTPCACGSSDFARAPLREHIGDRETISPMHMALSAGFKFGELYIIACRACGLASLWVSGIGKVPVGSNNIDPVRIGQGTPYR